MTKITPMMKQYLEIKNQNEDLIIFFRLGDFYEMFFDDAIKVSHELELTLTGKSAGLEERIPMCGIPFHAANSYIDKLIENGHKIGIVEQLEDPKTAKGIVKRGIVQIVSSGTNMDSETIKANDFNYIASITETAYNYVISYADVSTGELYAFAIEHNQAKVISEIINLNAKEVIMDSKTDKNIYSILKNQFHLTLTITDELTDDYSYTYKDIIDPRYILSVKHLLAYIIHNQKRDLNHLQKLQIKESKDYLKMDVHTKRNLELTETLRLKQRNYSLIWLLDKTKTAMGARTLKNYVLNPLVDKKEIEKRYDMVDTLIKEFILKSDLEKYLTEVYDLERLSGKIAFGNVNGKDLLQLKTSLKVFPYINEILKKLNFSKSLDDLTKLYNLLENSIYENPPATIKEGYLIKTGYNSQLDDLKKLRKGGKDFIAKFEQEEREKTGIKNLKVAYNRIFGYYIEISKGNLDLVQEKWGYQRKQTLANAERYISPVLKEKESLILNAEEKIINLEYELFIQIKDEVKKYIPNLQKCAKVISEIDVLASFATVSEANNYIRPEITKNELYIKEARHPVVEKVISSEFVSNDIIMDKNTNILLITGPNMAGKSTYMRQMAIIAIMAQIGCFVPASEAKLPIFDAIYTRIGASDDLVSGQSTFMVEMKEAAEAITQATDKSLLLFDELGRGTATFDGMALAQGILEYIHQNIKGKTFFSTHYHELTDLDKTLKHLKNIHVSAYEEDGKITFLHKIKQGSVDKSYGIHVAKLANLPSSVIKRAGEILKVYEANENKRDLKIQEALPIDDLMPKKSKIEEKLDKIDPLSITPMEALNILYELKNNKQN
ncbi:MAG: DNA mismatch repair protein MutS [Bacilli bacterium]|nr:DNA mismatch repair protein MutS [Bacilli bacterium]